MSEIFVTDDQKEYQRRAADKVRAHFAALGKTPLVYAETYGCQQNEADTEALLGLAAECGYAATDTAENADLVLVNTCAIREHAELKVFSKTGGLKKIKEKNPDMIVMLCGCMAQEPHVGEKIKKSYPYVDVVFGTDKNHRLPELILDRLSGGDRNFCVSDLPHGEFGVICENTPVTRRSSYKAWVSIMYGCNNYCTYCIVPYVRGRERSRRPEDVLDEIKRLADAGYKDITLLGQNVNSYDGGISFPELLRRASGIDGDFLLRFMTSHPKDASKELVDVMASSPKIARHFHLPVQSGSTRVLNAMNRRYTREQYLEKARYIKEKIPDAALTTDIICGFPGETEEEFDETVSLVREVGFDMLYCFIYSPRRGTAAEKMPGRIPHDEQVRRFERLTAAQNEMSLKANEKYVGKTLRLLSDGDEDGKHTARSSQNKIVTLDRFVPAGTFFDAEITAFHPFTLEGKVL